MQSLELEKGRLIRNIDEAWKENQKSAEKQNKDFVKSETLNQIQTNKLIQRQKVQTESSLDQMTLAYDRRLKAE